MHYGHPDVFDRIFHITRGGISKASRVINISEDIYSGRDLKYFCELPIYFGMLQYKVINQIHDGCGRVAIYLLCAHSIAKLE